VQKKLGLVAVMIALTGLIISLMSPASSDTRYERRTIRVVELYSDDDEAIFKNIDLGKEGDSVGDFIVYKDVLYKPNGAKVIGDFQAQFLFTEVGEDNLVGDVDASFDLPGGLITIEGPVDFGQRVEKNAVTGGTGSFKSAHGVVKIVQKEDRTLFVFQLLL
jgi:hypothetical protein